MLNNLNVLGSPGESLLLFVSTGDDHAGIPEEAVWWEATPDLPVRPLPFHLCGFENLSEFSAPGIVASPGCFDGTTVPRSENWVCGLSTIDRVKPYGCLKVPGVLSTQVFMG